MLIVMIYLEIFMLKKHNIQTTLAISIFAFTGLLYASSSVMAEDDSETVKTINKADVESVCPPGDNNASVLVHVENIASIEGNVRAQLYTDKEEDFLAKGKKLMRVEAPVQANAQSLCVPLPAVGNYSLVILHDKNANGKADFLSEGFGFSNNPKLRFGPPDVEDAAFVASEGVTEMTVSLQYVLGSDDTKKKRRRNSRRR
jgi:uncharacterized protein (DUF2141 family)